MSPLQPSSRPADYLLLHGLGSCAFDWDQVIENLRGRVVAPDAPFHGGRGPETDLSFEAFALDALSAADAAGFDRFVVGGISMGAATALTIASLQPDRLAGIVIVAPAWFRTREPVNLRRLQKIGKIVERDGLEAAFAVVSRVPPVATWSSIDRLKYQQRFLAAVPEAVGLALRSLPAQLPVLEIDPIRSGTPARVVTWGDDPIHPEAVAASVASLLGVDCEVLVRPKDRSVEGEILARLLTGVHFAGDNRPHTELSELLETE